MRSRPRWRGFPRIRLDERGSSPVRARKTVGVGTEALASLRCAGALALGLLVGIPAVAAATGAVAAARSNLWQIAWSKVGTIAAYGAPNLGGPAVGGPAVVNIAAAAGGRGYYVLRANGGVNNYRAPWRGSLSAHPLPAGVTATGIATDPATRGYWIVLSNGQVHAFHAPWLGQPAIPSGGWGQYPAAVGIAAAVDKSGYGYYVLRANGGVDHFGVRWHGSLAGHLPYGATAPVVATAIATDPKTGGYWLTTSTGGVFGYDAPSLGSPSTLTPGKYDGNTVTAIAADPSGSGYDVLRANGGIDNFGAPYHGSLGAWGGMPDGGFASGLAVDSSTGGYWEAIDSSPVSAYLNPLRGVTSLVPQEVDQGVDYCGSGPIYAIGDGTVENLYSSGWPSGVFISYLLTAGKAKGLVVYVAEDVTPMVTVGESIGPNTVVGFLHDAATCLETGWADAAWPYGLAAAHAEYNGENSTAYGLNFSSLLEALGARPGLTQPDGPPGPISPNWPTW